jgi:K+-transporting ATPase ATPase C chain
MSDFIKQCKTAFFLLLTFSLITGIIYPMIVSAIAQTLFTWKANGSFIEVSDKKIGSLLLGQEFTQPNYFWGRPSATPAYAYNTAYSAGSNLAPSNPRLLAIVKERVSHLHKADPENLQTIPVDLVTASASGLDPEISPLAAFYQVHRVALARAVSENDIHKLVQNSIIRRDLNILGEARVNVLKLNMALDRLYGRGSTKYDKRSPNARNLATARTR